MKKGTSSREAFFRLQFAFGILVTGIGVFLVLLSFGGFFKPSAQAASQSQSQSASPEIVSLVGPVSVDQNLNDLPYIAPKEEFEEKILTRHPHPGTGFQEPAPTANCPSFGTTILNNIMRPAPT